MYSGFNKLEIMKAWVHMSGSMGLGMHIQYRGNFGTYTPEYGEYVPLS